MSCGNWVFGFVLVAFFPGLAVPAFADILADPTLQLWLKADVGVLDSSGRAPGETGFDATEIATWQDQSGNSHNVTQTMSSKMPDYVTSVVNGQPALRFSGAENLINASYNPALGFTIFSVVKSSDAASIRGWFGGGDSKIAFGQQGTGTSYGTSASSFWAWAPNQYSTFGEANSLDTGWHAHAYVIPSVSESDWTWYLNGTLTGNADLITGTPQAYNEGIVVGAARSGSEYWRGDIAEILLFQKSLNSTELDEVGAYLNQKYDVTWDNVVPEPHVWTMVSVALVGLGLLYRRLCRRVCLSSPAIGSTPVDFQK